jgi:hypothetical protein
MVTVLNPAGLLVVMTGAVSVLGVQAVSRDAAIQMAAASLLNVPVS